MPKRYFSHHAEPSHIQDLRSVPLFYDLDSHELCALDDLLHQRTYLRDEIIFDQNEEGQAIYFVLSGKVGIYRDCCQKSIAELEVGQFFGERALLEDAPRVAQARAESECLLAVLFREDFLHLLQTHPEIAEKISLHCSLREANQPLEIEVNSQPSNIDTKNSPGPITWVGIIGITCLLIFIFKKLLWLVVPFLLALILYYLLSPISRRLILAGASRTLASIFLSSAFLLGFGLLVTLFYPLAISSMDSWQSHLSQYLSGGATLLQNLLNALQNHFTFLRGANFGNAIYLEFTDFTEHFSEKHLGNIVLTVSAWLPSLLLAPLMTFFLLKDGAELRKMVGSAVPNAFFEKTLYLIHALDKTAKLYFVGLIKITLIDTCIITLGLLLIGISNPLLLGIIAAILAWIPYLGPLLGCGIVIIVTSTDIPNNLNVIYSILGLFALVRILDDFVFLPVIVGKSLHIHPLLTLLMFMVGEAIAGIAGLMLVIPILAIVMVLGETLEIILTDLRLQARHKYAKRKSWQIANKDLVD
jgi:predicted PurR-regulated permease PerM